MDIKDILLVLQAGDGCEAQLAIAARLARENDALIDTVCVYPEPDLAPADCFAIGRAGAGDVLVHREEEIGRMVGALEAAHHKAIVDKGYGRSWAAGEIGERAWAVTRQARLADLVIAGLPRQDAGARRLAEALAIHSGAPCLFTPSLSPSAPSFERVLLAWDGSREAKRAMDDGLAIMCAAGAVSVVLVHEGGDQTDVESQGEAVRAHLARHGVQARVEVVSRPGERAGGVLLEQCATFDADVLIMGAYGHGRAREMVLGGATRMIFAHARQPVLMSH
ncbi:MAG: universal stress protein [Caulobacteraceae bacterium]|jgi:nucleotide-binding universal stress UspA family protein